jgi:hypothetical protein
VVVAPPGQKAAFEQALSSDARLVFRIMDYAEALSAAKLSRVPDGAAAEALFVHLAARHAPSEQFASREDRRSYFIWQLQRGIVGAGIAVFALCALFGGYRWLQVLSVRGDAAEQTEQANAAAAQYARITSTFPVTDTTTENLKATVVEFRRIAERTANPDQAFRHISRVLERHPQFELDTLRWSIAKPSELRASPNAAKPPAQAPSDGSDTVVMVELSGRVNATQRNDYRGITGQVQGFASALVGDGFELVRTQLPFDVTPEGVLTGDIGTSADTGEAPRFTVTLSRRLP